MNHQIDFQQLCSDSMLEAARQLVSEKRVELKPGQYTEEGGMILRAAVVDQFNFMDRVRVQLDETGTEIVDYRCTCQPASSNSFCKHCAAAVLQYEGDCLTAGVAEPEIQEQPELEEPLWEQDDLARQLDELAEMLRQLTGQGTASEPESDTESLHEVADVVHDFPNQQEPQILQVLQKFNQLDALSWKADKERDLRISELCAEIKKMRQLLEQMLESGHIVGTMDSATLEEAPAEAEWGVSGNDEESSSADEKSDREPSPEHRSDETEVSDTYDDAPQDGGMDMDAAPDYLPNEVPQEMEILFGHDPVTGEPLLWRPNNTSEVFHTNTGIIGTMGTGKTQFTKSLITQLYRNQQWNFDGKPLGILIFDYKGDYNESKMDFVQAVNAKVYRPYRLPLTPFALTQPRVKKNLLPIHVANTFIDTLGKIHHLGPKQRKRLLDSILEAYEVCGIYPDVPLSWSKTPPTFSQVYEIYAQKAESDNSDSLAAVMSKLESFQLFENNPKNTVSLMQLLRGVVVLDLSGYDADIQHLIVAITLDLFYAQMQAMGSSQTNGSLRQLTKLILVDEADSFMQENFASLKKIMKEGREFGVGVILSTQYLDHFTTSKDDYSKYVLSWIVHNVRNLKNSSVEYIFALKHGEPKTQELCDRIRALEKHHSIVKIGNQAPCEIRDKAFWELMCE